MRRTLLKGITTMNMEALSIFSNAANQDVSAASPFIPPTVLNESRTHGVDAAENIDPRSQPPRAPQPNYSRSAGQGVYVERNR